MPLALAERSGLIAPSATLAMGAEARRLKAQGIEVLDFALGEPDFDTPDEHPGGRDPRRCRSGQTHYTPPAGIPELRQAVADHYTQQHGLPTEPAQVVISNGAKHSIHNALMAVCGPGDEVIIPAPYWVSYSDLVKLTGATPVIITTTEAARVQADARPVPGGGHAPHQAADDQQPVQPDGRGLRPRRAGGAGRRGARRPTSGVLSDEIYEQLTYGDAQPTCFATLRPGLAERTITISGVSKTYAMTGWRIGWAVAPAPVAKFMGDLQSQETSNPCSVSQWAALEAITGPAGFGRRDESRVSEAARLRPGADRRAARRDLPAAGRCVLRLHEHLGPLRPDARRQADSRFDRVLHDRTERSQGGAGHGLGVRRRRLCPAVVCHRPADAREGLRRARSFLRD